MWTRWSWRWWNCWEWFLVSPICVKGLETGKSCLVVPDFMRKIWVFCWKLWKPNLKQKTWQKTWYYSLLIEKVKKKTNKENVQKYFRFCSKKYEMLFCWFGLQIYSVSNVPCHLYFLPRSGHALSCVFPGGWALFHASEHVSFSMCSFHEADHVLCELYYPYHVVHVDSFLLPSFFSVLISVCFPWWWSNA